MALNSYSNEEILAKVKEIIEGILQIETDGISANSSLIDDLGMEPIDFLDLDIRLEETFNISVPRRPPLQRMAAVFGWEKLAQEGKITQIYEGTNQIQRNAIAAGLLRRRARRG